MHNSLTEQLSISISLTAEKYSSGHTRDNRLRKLFVAFEGLYMKFGEGEGVDESRRLEEDRDSDEKILDRHRAEALGEAAKTCTLKK